MSGNKTGKGGIRGASDNVVPFGVVVDPSDLRKTAHQVIAQCYAKNGVRTIHFHGDLEAWLHWNGATCRKVKEHSITVTTGGMLTEALCRRDNKLVSLKPSRKLISDVVWDLRNVATVDNELPAWLAATDPNDNEGLPAAGDIFACANALIDLRHGLPYPPNPRFLSITASDVLWRDQAECPRWLSFLNQIFEHDQDQVTELQKWLGYLLMNTTSLQTALLLIGPPRSGKGTTARVFRSIIGTQHYAGPSLASFAERFGLAPLIGKRLLVVDEATLGPKVDRSEVGSVLRKMIGEDTFTIDRKHGEAWTGPLPSKLMLIVNELPIFSDASGALASRFIVLQTKHSFVGEEDRTLEGRLMEELPGILRWGVEGARRLFAGEGFRQPAATGEALRLFKDQMADVSAFVDDECELGPALREDKVALYEAYKQWRAEVGFDEKTCVSREHFGRKLMAARPSVKQSRPRSGDERRRYYTGIELKNRRGELALGK